jgi:hypothetical protein
MNEFTIRTFQEADIPAILNLFSISFHKEATREWFVWKYRESPWTAQGYVMMHGDDLAAFYGGLKLQYILRGEVLWAYQFCDVMTHTRYRGRIFGRNPLIIKAARIFDEENPMDFALGFPSERHARLQTLMMGGTSYRHINAMKKEIKRIKNSRPGRYRVSYGWDSLKNQDIDTIWKKSVGAFTLALTKDSRYITWRYRNHPSGDYKAIVLKGMVTGKVVAYAVIKLSGEEMHVLDFLIPEQRLYAHFWKVLEASADDFGLRFIVTWANSSEEAARYLIASGYECFTSIPFGVRIREDGRFREDEFYREYAYRMGDYDAS